MRQSGSNTLPLFRFVLTSLVVGCASDSYRYGNAGKTLDSHSVYAPATVAMGGPHPKLDRLEAALHYPPEKFREWFRRLFKPKDDDQDLRTDDRKRSEAVLAAQEYLMLNGLSDVRIEVREYNPELRWQAMMANPRVNGFWKYTTGTLEHVRYSLLPDRVFRNDSYSVYTHTLSINSTANEEALYAAAKAKYLQSRRYPGAFDAACYLPIVPLFRDSKIADDALSYARARSNWELEKELYPEIYRQIGSDAVSQATSLIPAAAVLPFYARPILSGVGGAVGGMTGQAVLKVREKEIEAAESGPDIELAPAIQ